MANIMQLFTGMLIMSLFYSFAITTMAHATEGTGMADYVTSGSDLADRINLGSTADTVQSSLEEQVKIPNTNLGALMFYSGNLLMDLLLNFVFAVPSMIAVLFQGLMSLVGIDFVLSGAIQAFFASLFSIIYFIGIIQLLMGLRSGTGGMT